MRDIEFRGKCKSTIPEKNGRWVYGFLTLITNGSYSIGKDGTDFNIIIPETVGQYTGLKDRNGVKIFEGDFIKRYSWSGKTDPYEYRAAIFFEKGCFLIKKPDTCYRSGFDPNGSSLHEEIRHIEEFKQEYPEAELYIEVIGNIHDNPGMLK